MKDQNYQQLQVIEEWTTQVNLGGKPLDYSKRYDIQAPGNSQIFENCEVYCVSFNQPAGHMETMTKVIPFLKSNELEIRLKTGFLMRINERQR